jgi:hypothetical protein
LLDPIWVKAVAKSLVLPPTGLLLLALVGLALSRRFPRAGRAMAWSGVVALLALSIPVVSGFLIRSLDTAPPFDIANVSGARAVVIIGGGVRRHAAEFGGDTLGDLTLERVRYGAVVARLTRLPILVSGGSVYGGETEAKMMAQALEREFGQHVQWLEERSRNTHENAQRSGNPAGAGIQRVIWWRTTSTCRAPRRVRGCGYRDDRGAYGGVSIRRRCSTFCQAWARCGEATSRSTRSAGTSSASFRLRTSAPAARIRGHAKAPEARHTVGCLAY